MAKKKRVDYSFGTPAAYQALAVKNPDTVYFIVDSSGYGTLYKGDIPMGSIKASEIIFNRTFSVTATNGEEQTVIGRVEEGDTLEQVVKNIYRDYFKEIYDQRDSILDYADDTFIKVGASGERNIDTIISLVRRDSSTMVNTLRTDVSTNYLTKDESDSRYVAGSELSNIRALAELFSDDEKMEQLLEAAQGIESIMSQYYNKEYIDTYVDNVITKDSSAEFPEEGEINKIYIEDATNTMYRWATEFEGLDDRAYIPISGGGGAGGGSSDVKVESAIYVKNGKTTASVAKGNSYTIEFAFSSANTYTSYNKKTGQFEKVLQQTGKLGTAKYFIDGVQFDSGSVRQAIFDDENDSKNVYNSYTVPAGRLNGSEHTIKIVVTDIAGNTAEEQIKISMISVSIASSFVSNPTQLTKALEIPVTVAASGEAKVYYTIDNEDVVESHTLPTGSGTNVITIQPIDNEGNTRAHGVHYISIWATTYIAESDTLINTDTLKFEVIWYNVGDNTPIIATSTSEVADTNNEYSSVQYEYVAINYQVYPSSTIKLTVKDLNTNVERVINTLSSGTGKKIWTYTFDTYGKFALYIDVEYNNGNSTIRSTEYVFNVAKAAYSLEAEEGSDMFFTAKNRSNDEAEEVRSVWHSEIGDYDASLTGFAWNANSGWNVNGNVTSLRVASGAKCIIPYAPFDNDYRTTGQVIEFDFSTSNLSDSTTTVISCMDETTNTGIEITANCAYFTSSQFSLSDSADARIKVPFKENERVRIAFVITPLNADDSGKSTHNVSIWDPEAKSYITKESVSEGWWRFVKVYINGICTSIQNYISNQAFVQDQPAYITIGSDKATVDVYSIRSYKKALYDRALVGNYVADTQDPAERLRLYLRNNILTTSGTDIDYGKLLSKMPCMFVTCECDVTDTTTGFANLEHILPTSKKDKRGFTVIYNCEQLDEESREKYPFVHSFVAYNAQMTVQGTSSQYYPRKNYKLTFKPEKKLLAGKDLNLASYNSILGSKKPTMVFMNTTGSNVGQTGEGASETGKANRLAEATTFKSNYTNKYTLKDYSLTDFENTSVDTITSLPGKKFCMKADFAEASSTHNTGMAKYVDYILKSLGRSFLTPPQKAQFDAVGTMNKVNIRTTVDGYPTAIFWRKTYNDEYSFLGKYNFNYDKGEEGIFGFVDITDSINPMTGQPFLEFDEDYYDAASKEDRLLYEPPVECWEFTNNSASISKFKYVTDDMFNNDSEEYGKEWLGSFEARHPDNDNYASDLEQGKNPVHWKEYMKWVSSTDRDGYHDSSMNYKVPTAWNDTYLSLISGDSNVETFETYNGTLEAMNEDILTNFDYNKGYILEPLVIVDMATMEYGPDDSYLYFGYIARYNTETNLWYVDKKYDSASGSIDYTKWYYINKSGEAEYKNVYKYDTETSAWVLAGTLEANYRLAAPATYNTIVYNYDTAEYRLAKFKYELPNHMNIDMTTAYYVLTEFFACVDQRAKNMMFATWGYEPGPANVKSANTFSSEEEANAAGYKGVYSYSLGTIASAPNPYATRTRGGDMILGAAPSTVCINEIYPDGKKMEFYNPTNSAITLTGYVLKGIDETGVVGSRADWTFPAGASIEAKGFYTIEFVKGNTEVGPGYGLSGKKSWSFTLEDNNGNVIDTITNNLYTDGVTGFAGSWGRSTDGGDTWTEFETPSIGYSNALTFVNHVCINEVSPNALSLDYPTQKGVELYNPTASDVNLNGWILRKGDVACDSFYYLTGEVDKNGNPKSKQLNSVDDPVNSKSVTFDSNAVVPAHGYFVVVFNDGVTPNTMPGGLGPKAGFTLRLYDNNNNLVDELDNSPKVAYAEAPAEETYIEGTDVATNNIVYVVDREYMNLEGSSADHTEYRSWGRIVDGATTWVIFDTGTPGLDNTTDMTPKYDVTDLLDITKYTCRGNELSGLIYNNTNTGFVAVSDTGVIYDITLDGEVTAKTIENYDPNVRFLGVSSTTGKTWMQSIGNDGEKVFEDVTDNVPNIIPNSDLEAITKDSNGNIYIMSEYRQLSIKSTDKYPVYTDNVTGEETFEPTTNGVANAPIMSKGVQKTKKKDLDTADVYAYIYKLNGNRLEIVTKLDVNESMEGFCYYKDNLFFVGKQVTGKIYIADLTGATANDTVSLTEFADLTQYIAEVADVAYDGEFVYALDSEEKSISKVSISSNGSTGTFVEKFMLTITEANPEGLLVDKPQNIFWVCCDDDITDPSAMVNNYKNLFKVAMDNSNYVPAGIDPGTPITTHVVLNEFDGEGKRIELYNPTDASVNLGGMWLVKTPQDPGFNDEITITEANPVASYDTWQFPVNTVIGPKGFFVVTCGQTNENVGPTFGLSLKAENKKFDMYLMTDASSLRNAIGAQTVDMSKVIDHADNYTNPTVIANNAGTFGRVKDGYSNFCVFKSPGTIGSSNDLGEIQGPANSGEGSVPSATTNKTALYWVPIDCEYIYYPIFYDNDTIMSLNNTGYIRYEPNVESTDKVGTGYAYNGTESVLWLNFKDAYASEIANVYSNMRAHGLDYPNCIRYFNETQSDLWPEVLYNLDAKFKYVDPATVGYIDFSQKDQNGVNGVTIQEGGYLYECQGSRAEHRKWWLTNRFIYMDSRYNTGSTYKDSYATMRLYTPANWSSIEPNPDFTITPYADMYLRVRFGSIDAYVRAEKNKPYVVSPIGFDSRFNNTETIIYGAPYILSFGQMADKYADSVAIGNASKITDLLLGAASPYYNENLENLTVGATNTSLKNIDVRGCKKLRLLNGISQITSIESVLATDTALTDIDFSTEGANLKRIAYPASIAMVKLVKMNYLTNNNISFVNYSNLSTVWIEDCPNINTWLLLYNILNTANNKVSRLRINNINWNIQTQRDYEIWNKILSMRGIADDGSYSLLLPYLTGTVTIGAGIVVSNGYKTGLEAKFREQGCDLTVNVVNTTGLSGIVISGNDTIAPNRWYTYKVSYLPDDFVLAADKGVEWTAELPLQKRNVTAESIEISYQGSTTGQNYYTISAVSTKDPSKTATLSIRPTATLESIKIYDSTGNEVDYNTGIDIYEGDSATFTVGFLPEGTADDAVDITVTNGQYLKPYGLNYYEYSDQTKQLTITATEVSKRENAAIKVASHNLPSIYRTVPIHINNIVSRVIYLQDENGVRLQGSVKINVEGDSTDYYVYTASNNPGVITLVTNKFEPDNTEAGKGYFGLRKIKIEAHAQTELANKYNKPDAIIMEELPASVSTDIERTFTFYEPITARIRVINSGANVTDKNLLIKSFQNETIRSLTTGEYNNVVVGTDANPATIKLLANTTHEITISELDDAYNLIPENMPRRYSSYSGTITTGSGSNPFDYTIAISRDYLGNVASYDNTELHMTVVTGQGDYKTVRLYYRTTGPIVINWGDEDEQTSGAHLSALQNPQVTEAVIYHTYKTSEKEYEITVTNETQTINSVECTSNTQYIRWFHVISETATEMKPCFGTGTNQGFADSFAFTTRGGLVAYQSSGAAVFETMPRFNFRDKTYSKILCVGNIYKNCTEATSADSLFENSTVEQIPSTPMFEKCVNIKSFNKTFKNSNITTLPSSFFVYNEKATSFTETFSGCETLSSIGSEEDVQFLFPGEDVEITSLKNMFYGCTSLVSEVPGFWKTFYGCSFADAAMNIANAQKTFQGCIRCKNYDNIPYSWGGNTSTPEYTQTSSVNPLKYVYPGRTHGLVYFELGNVLVSANYRYEYTFKTPNQNWYETQPLFGAGIAEDINDDSTITRVMDFHRGGSGTESKPNMFTGYLSYRILSPADTWNAATSDGRTYVSLFSGEYGGRSNDIYVLDICHSQDRKAKLYKKNDSSNYAIANVDDWSYSDDATANLPLRIYYTYHLNDALAYRYEDVTAYVAQDLYFYELKIYNALNELVHDIVPGYAVINNVSAPVLYDKLDDTNIYPATGPGSNYINYYIK